MGVCARTSERANERKSVVTTQHRTLSPSASATESNGKTSLTFDVSMVSDVMTISRNILLCLTLFLKDFDDSCISLVPDCGDEFLVL